MHISDKLLITWHIQLGLKCLTFILLLYTSLKFLISQVSALQPWFYLYFFFVVGLLCFPFSKLILGLLKPAVANRVSLRLQVGISFCDLLFHLLLTQYKTSIEEELCAFIGFAHVALRQWYCFLFIAIGVNLQLIFIHDLNPKPRWEVMYWVIPIILTLVMNIPPLVLGEFGMNTEHEFCFFKDKNRSNAFLILNIATTLFFAFTYCTAISILVISRIRDDWALVAAATLNQVNPSVARLKALEKKMKQLTLRIALYPCVILVTLSGYAVYYVVFFVTGDSITFLRNWSLMGQTLTGFLNFGAFCFDPSFHYCMNAIVKDLRKRLVRAPPVNTENPLEEIRCGSSPPFDPPGSSLDLDLQPVSCPDPYNSGDDDEYRFTIFDDAECRAAMNLF